MKCISILEVSKKQAYIFNSNKLKDNIGASLIVRYISEELAYDRNWLKCDDPLQQCSSYTLMEGGGQAVYVFPCEEEAVAFNRNVTGFVLQAYPGVEMFCIVHPFDNESTLITDALAEAFRKMAVKKGERSNVAVQTSYGFHEVCTRTGMPASHTDDNEFISDEIYAKRQFAKREQKKAYASLIPEGYEIPTELEQLDDLAVIHIDGNQMGKKLTAFQNHYKKTEEESVPEFNERYRNEFCKFSKEVDDCYKRAFTRMTAKLHKYLNNQPNDSDTESNELPIFPLRPLIAAGDDISFVTSGPIGIRAARMFLEELQLEAVNVGSQYMTMHACAGIAFVKKGYPFSRAHQLAEQLCTNAKTRILEQNRAAGIPEEQNFDFSALDFHILSGDSDESLRNLRKQQYSPSANTTLCLKPYYVTLPEKGSTYLHDSLLPDGASVKQLPRSSREALMKEMERGFDQVKPFPDIELFEAICNRVQSMKLSAKKLKVWIDVHHKTESEQRYFIVQEAMETVLLQRRDLPKHSLHVTRDGIRYAIYYDAIELLSILGVRDRNIEKEV
ncbi:hypothetical protein ACFFK0_26615 [Paenibacillus chartarius]|uniref:Uncharacterized protein n=1 Tax=Paenibacillus chartarius TaxID=747481 RepID=A0ABV6DTK2_9BACL